MNTVNTCGEYMFVKCVSDAFVFSPKLRINGN